VALGSGHGYRAGNIMQGRIPSRPTGSGGKKHIRVQEGTESQPVQLEMQRIVSLTGPLEVAWM